jgi:putative hydrolase of the HAD superfamily
VGRVRRVVELSADGLRREPAPSLQDRIVSNSFVGASQREHDAYGFRDAFDTIVYSHEVGHRKPEPAIYAIASERLGVKPQEVLFLDDLQANGDGARAVGMNAIRFLNTEQAILDLSAQLTDVGRA